MSTEIPFLFYLEKSMIKVTIKSGEKTRLNVSYKVINQSKNHMKWLT